MTELIRDFKASRPIAWRHGAALTQGEFLADLLGVAAGLPEAAFAINLCEDRYNFLVAFAAAAVRGQISLFPNSAAPTALAQIAAQYPGAVLLHDDEAPALPIPARSIRCVGGRSAGRSSLPRLDADRPLIHAFTSGTTGAPQAVAKTWRAVVAGAIELENRAGPSPIRWLSIVATVPSAHSYGLETTVAPPLLNGSAIACGRPLFPADVKAALDGVAGPRCLVTTPLHLKALIASSVVFPPIGLVMCATAPLPTELACQAEARLGARILEIYGSTESGYVATRWVADGGDWLLRDDMRLDCVGDRSTVAADFLPEPVPLADVIEPTGERCFRLMGRSADMINIAGKRASLSGMSRILMDIDGVEDGVILAPAPENGSNVSRLVAVVVAPGLSQDAIRRAFRQRVDPVFVPRQVVLVDALPRNETGKLPLDRLLATLGADRR